MSAAVSMLEKRASDNDESDPVLEAMRNALAEGRKALDQLNQQMPAKQRPTEIPVNINQVTREVISILAQKMSASGVDFSWNPQSHLPHIVGSENRLRTMIKQLVENAMEAMEKNKGARDLTINSRLEKDFIVLEVIDSGPGIDDDLALKVFEPFFTTKSVATSGRGLGLAMVQEIVNDHAGMVSLDKVNDSNDSSSDDSNNDTQPGCKVIVHLPVTHDSL